MSNQYPQGGWPYGSSAFQGPDYQQNPDYPVTDYGDSEHQQIDQTGAAPAPIPGHFTLPPAAPPTGLPFPFPAYTTPVPGTAPAAPGAPGGLPLLEQSYIENILRLNLEKTVTLYATFEGNKEWNAKIFSGELEAAGRDHVIIKDKNNVTRYLIPMVFVNYFTFEGSMNYSYPFAAGPRP